MVLCMHREVKYRSSQQHMAAIDSYLGSYRIHLLRTSFTEDPQTIEQSSAGVGRMERHNYHGIFTLYIIVVFIHVCRVRVYWGVKINV